VNKTIEVKNEELKH